MNGIVKKQMFGKIILLTFIVSSFCLNGCKEIAESKLNGHEYVDLGLPSGTLWATCNVGAINPEDYGDYFAWGETTPTDGINYKYEILDEDLHRYFLTKYHSEDNLKTLEPSDDAATTNWGVGWRTPTQEEFSELALECKWEHAECNGVGGSLVTGPNGNSIFLPKAGIYNGRATTEKPGEAGDYWSCSLYSKNTREASSLRFCGCNRNANYSTHMRSCGLTIRPVAHLQK